MWEFSDADDQALKDIEEAKAKIKLNTGKGPNRMAASDEVLRRLGLDPETVPRDENGWVIMDETDERKD